MVQYLTIIIELLLINEFLYSVTHHKTPIIPQKGFETLGWLVVDDVGYITFYGINESESMRRRDSVTAKKCAFYYTFHRYFPMFRFYDLQIIISSGFILYYKYKY